MLFLLGFHLKWMGMVDELTSNYN